MPGLKIWRLGSFPHNSVGKESICNAGDPGLTPGSGRFPWRRERLPTPVFLVFSCGSAGKESGRNVGDLGSIPHWEDPWRSKRLPTPVFRPGEFHGLYSPWGYKGQMWTPPWSLLQM